VQFLRVTRVEYNLCDALTTDGGVYGLTTAAGKSITRNQHSYATVIVHSCNVFITTERSSVLGNSWTCCVDYRLCCFWRSVFILFDG